METNTLLNMSEKNKTENITKRKEEEEEEENEKKNTNITTTHHATCYMLPCPFRLFSSLHSSLSVVVVVVVCCSWLAVCFLLFGRWFVPRVHSVQCIQMQRAFLFTLDWLFVFVIYSVQFENVFFSLLLIFTSSSLVCVFFFSFIRSVLIKQKHKILSPFGFKNCLHT